jgi:uncharacterized protein YqjF (DUF2071 family)
MGAAADARSRVTDRDFDYGILDRFAHRPWPMPPRPWVMTQTWHDLLFAHWRIEPERLRALVPSVFPLDLFEGEAWVGVVPFFMTNVAPRPLPSVPGLSEFPELNVRTYVSVGGKAGVYFFSLDAASATAVRAARTLLNLPYFTASMEIGRTGGAIEYRSVRTSGGRRGDFRAAYEPAGEVFTPVPGTREYFLTERYCLYHIDRRGRPYRLDIHHPPWPLQAAHATIDVNTMAAASAITLPDVPPIVHYARRQDTVAWLPARVAEEPTSPQFRIEN